MGYLGKLIVAKGFRKWPKVQKITQSGHTDCFVGKFLTWRFVLRKVLHVTHEEVGVEST